MKAIIQRKQIIKKEVNMKARFIRWILGSNLLLALGMWMVFHGGGGIGSQSF